MTSLHREKAAVGTGRRVGVFPWWRLGVGLVVVALVSVLASGVGAVAIPPLTVVKIGVSRLPLVELAETWPDTWDTIVWQLRLPRVVLAAIEV